MQCTLKTFDIPNSLNGKVFQTECPEKARLVLCRSMRGLGSVYRIALLLLSLKREVM